MILTFQDSVERLVDYLGAQPTDTVLRDAKVACIEALRDLTQCYSWTYLYRHGRIITTTAYDEGTLTYLVSDGQYPFQITLSGGSWPDWAGLGCIRIGDTNYDVDRRISGSILTLAEPFTVADDIIDPTAFGLFQDSYTLPTDFASQDTVVTPENWCGLRYVHPRDWLFDISQWGTTGTPRYFTILQDPDHAGLFSLRLSPLPLEPLTLDFIYKRRPAPLSVFKAYAGTLATAAGSNVAVGTGTAFAANMANGSVLRISGNTKPPTAEFGDNPAAFESKVIAVDTVGQALTLYDPLPTTYTAAPYVVSSIVDLTTGTMAQAYARCAEYHINISRTLKDKPSARLAYAKALEIAKCADSRTMEPRSAGQGGSYRRRLRDIGPLNLGRES